MQGKKGKRSKAVREGEGRRLKKRVKKNADKSRKDEGRLLR